MSEHSQQLWQQLQQADLVNGAEPTDNGLDSPWYIRLMLGFSGWFAALFILGFIGAAFSFVFREEGVSIVLGAGLLLIVYLLLKEKQQSDFFAQLGLAVSFSGQALVIFGLFDLFNTGHQFGNALIWMLITLFQAALAWWMNNRFHRAWSAFIATLSFALVLASLHILYIQTALVLLVMSLLWLNEYKVKQVKRVTAIAYGITIGLIIVEASTLFRELFIQYAMRGLGPEILLWRPWMGELATALVMLLVVIQLLQRYQLPLSGRVGLLSLLGTLLVAILSVEAPGIAVGLVILLLGFANSNRLLLGLGIIALLFYIGSYYYMLENTLLDKAQLLLVLGIVLMLLRLLFNRLFKAEAGEQGHA